LLCGMEQARRPTLAHHVHRTAPMGPRVLINGIWYKREVVKEGPRRKLPMRSLKFSVLDAFGNLRTSGFVRPAAEKFGGAWLACFLVMARGNVLAAFSFEHLFRASVCGIVSAVVAVALLAQMDRTIDSAARQATISAIATFLGDVFAHPSHFPPQWAEPTVTAIVSGGIAIALWHAKRWAKRL